MQYKFFITIFNDKKIYKRKIFILWKLFIFAQYICKSSVCNLNDFVFFLRKSEKH